MGLAGVGEATTGDAGDGGGRLGFAASCTTLSTLLVTCAEQVLVLVRIAVLQARVHALNRQALGHVWVATQK